VSERLTVEEAADAYAGVMRNMAPAGPGVCATCRTFITPAFKTCWPCDHQPNHFDAILPITYSEHLGQMHTALRNYKDATGAAQRYAMVRLTAILWRFLEIHETCAAQAAHTPAFDLVTAVPSSTPERDNERVSLRTMLGWCKPVNDRFRRVLAPTGDVPVGRGYDTRRYSPTDSLTGQAVLLVDDTWATGGHAQSAAHALKEAGAKQIALVVIGRHIHRERDISPGDPTAGRLDALPSTFDWTTCAFNA
jgi:predicted amidophosphoribosyltransferase